MAKKDAIMKSLTKSLSGGALQAIGVYGVELADPLPTELPANVLQVDMVWRMQDDRMFHLEFQSKREDQLYRFLEYDARLARRHRLPLRTVVLYHESVKMAPDQLDIGTAKYQVENVYLSDRDGDAALDEVTQHLRVGTWTSEDRLRLALAVNMKLRNRNEAIERIVTLVNKVQGEEERELVVAAILELGDKGLSEPERQRMRKELMRVSKMAQELYDEGREEGRVEERTEIARAALADGMDNDRVARLTGLSLEKIEEIRRDMSH